MDERWIPIPREMLRRSQHPGKFQDRHPTVTVNEFRKAVEIFSEGKVKVMTKRESQKAYNNP